VSYLCIIKEQHKIERVQIIPEGAEIKGHFLKACLIGGFFGYAGRRQSGLEA